MEQAEIRIWVILTLYGGVGLVVLGTGLFALVEQFYVFGAILSVVGLVGVIDAGRRALGHGFRISNPVLVAMLVLTWIFFGYDIYDRHSHALGYQGPTQWNEESKALTSKTGDFSHRTIPLDGYRYFNCNMDGSTLLFEGRLPSEVINCKGIFQIGSHNPAIDNALGLAMAICNLGGKTMESKTVEDLPALPSP